MNVLVCLADRSLYGCSDLLVDVVHMGNNMVHLDKAQAPNPSLVVCPLGLTMCPNGHTLVRMDTDKERDEIRRAVGDEIRAARARRHLSQDELANASGLSHSTIVRLEAGKRTVDIIQLLSICKVLRVDAGKLLDLAQNRD